jgi:uridine phosphorylase
MQINSVCVSENNLFLPNLNLKLNGQLKLLFKGVSYVVMQGSKDRSLDFAWYLSNLLGIADMRFFTPVNLFNTNNFCAYRVGDVLCVSHGMGSSSILLLLSELTKLLYFSECFNVKYIRVGTSGGIGVAAGTVIVTNKVFAADLVDAYTVYENGEAVLYPTVMDQELNQGIFDQLPKSLEFKVQLANSISADDFYLSQARFDGALKPSYDYQLRSSYFDRIKKLGIANFEMEGLALSYFCGRVAIPATMVAVTLVDREDSDQIRVSKEVLESYSLRSRDVVCSYLLSKI